MRGDLYILVDGIGILGVESKTHEPDTGTMSLKFQMKNILKGKIFLL